MNEVQTIKTVRIKDLRVLIYDEKKEKIEINISYFMNKAIIQDLKLLLFFQIKDNKLLERTEIDIVNEDINLLEYKTKKISLETEIPDFIKNKEDYIESGKNRIIKLGNYKVTGEKTIKPLDCEQLFEIIKEKYYESYTSDIWKDCIGKDNLSKIFDNYKKDKKEIIDNYINSDLLKIYYFMLLESSKINNEKRIAGKVSAMCSYLAVKKYLKKYFDDNKDDNKLEYEVSNPNVFIKNNNREYDALVIKKKENNKENNNEKFLFSKEDVVATIEIKTSGYFTSKEKLLTNEGTNEFIKYLKDEKIEGIPHIYISLYESFGEKSSSIHYYEYLLANLSSLEEDEYYGIFCCTKKDQNCFLIPYEYDLKIILNKIFKK